MYSHGMTNKRSRRALIIGGGIAGPITAMALHRAGIEATVHEAYDYAADGVGSFLTVAVNGQRALAELDLLHILEGKGFDCPRFEFFTGKGRRLGGFAAAPPREDTLTSRTITRAELYKALRDEALRRGVKIEYGHRLVDARESRDGVVATFQDGSTAEGDFLVGADGLLSTTRRLVDPRAPKPRYIPLLNTGGWAAPDRAPRVDSEVGTMAMYFGRDAFYCHMKAPDGTLWWFANVPQVRELSAAELQQITDEQWRQRLMETFAVDTTPATAVIAATDAVARPWNTYDFPKVPTWHTDRLVLVGDAAHAASPTSGQGASLAIEDALTLAKCLRDMPDTPTAFVAYVGLRRKRVEKIVAAAKRRSSDKMPGPVGRTLRDLVFPLVLARAGKAGQDEVLDYRIRWADPVRG
jgi:2-polyprenyl-6-methoxyphenol hydroxylase-like FAD-dependent oxidoreductase